MLFLTQTRETYPGKWKDMSSCKQGIKTIPSRKTITGSFKKSLKYLRTRSKSVIRADTMNLSKTSKMVNQERFNDRFSVPNRDSRSVRDSFNLLETPEKKWEKIVNLYNMPDKLSESKNSPVQPAGSFYRTFLHPDVLHQFPVRINFPQTTMVDSQGTVQMLYTNHKGYLAKKSIEKEECQAEMVRLHNTFLQKIRAENRDKKEIDPKYNRNAPLAITKFIEEEGDLNFETEVETFRLYEEKRPKPARNKLIQRFIYSRNMKSMIYRVCYDRCPRNQQKEEYSAYRFQNIAPIFKVNPKKDSLQIHKLTATIAVSNKRMNTLESSKLTAKTGLWRFLEQMKELKQFLERVYHVQINNLYVDFMFDLLDCPWVINIKHIKIDTTCRIISLSEQNTVKVGDCKLCSSFFSRQQLRNKVSVRMLYDFVCHLRKRTKLEDAGEIEFLQQMSLNLKENSACYVCDLCYGLIIEEFELMKWEKKFASLCNIRVCEEAPEHIHENEVKKPLMQWRLMLYLEDIKSIYISPEYRDTLYIKYKLSGTSKIQEKWKCKFIDNQHISINNFKAHYFYSESSTIDNFLKNTEIFITFGSSATSKYDSEGSTKIISTFKNHFVVADGQRQTTTILLFQEDKNYCELTMKLGLVCDGTYQIPINNLRKSNAIYYTLKDYINCNAFPEEWMEIFSLNYHPKPVKVDYQDIITKYTQNTLFQRPSHTHTKLKKKKLHFYDIKK